MGKEVGDEEGNGVDCSPDGECAGTSCVLCLEVFIPFLQAGILGEVSGEGFSRKFTSSPGAPF